jgi:uncharacterized protein involved in response to NO
MNEFIEKNRRFLKFCSDMARFYGLLLLCVVGIVVAIFVIVVISGSMEPEMLRKVIRTQTLSNMPKLVFHGFLALVVAEFISYLIASEGEPKWILRNGDKIIYAYVLFIIVIVIRVFYYTSTTSEFTVRGLSHLGPNVLIAISEVARVLMWVGIGITLKKVLPIIKESKLLV